MLTFDDGQLAVYVLAIFNLSCQCSCLTQLPGARFAGHQQRSVYRKKIVILTNLSHGTRRLYYCQDDTIPLALLPIFRDKEGYPVINFANVNYLRSRHRVPIRGLSEMILDLRWRQCIPRHQSCRLRVPIRGHPETSGKGQNYNVESWWWNRQSGLFRVILKRRSSRSWYGIYSWVR